MSRKRWFARSAGWVFLCCLLCASCATTRQPVPAAQSAGQTVALAYKFGEDLDKEFGYLGSTYIEPSSRPGKKLTAEPVYRSKRPLYGTVKLGTDKDGVYTLVIDESKGTGTGYDTMYVDANGNRDLTDDPKLTAAPRENENDNRFVFPVVELAVRYGDATYPYHMKPVVDSYGSTSMSLSSAGCCTGDITLGTKTYKVAVFDDTGNGLFNDPYVAPKNMGGDQVYGQGDVLVIDLNGDGKFEKSYSDTPELHHAGKYLSFGNTCYEISISPNGRNLTLKETGAKSGYITTGSATASVELLGDQGALKLHGKKTVVPEGKYQFYACRLEGKDDKGKVWRIIGNGLRRQPAVNVEAKKKTKLAFGPPLTAEVSINKREDGAYVVALSIKGQGGEAYSAGNFELVDKDKTDRPPAPKVKIVDKDGITVAQGNFEYG